MLSLREAARYANTSKTSILRWIKSGKISASKAVDGAWLIDQSELARVLDSVNSVTAVPDRIPTPDQSAPVPSVAVLQERIAALEQVLAIERERVAEWRTLADQWRAQAERLALAPPVKPRVPLLRRLFGG
jgi:excisionase family DNA binding protein